MINNTLNSGSHDKHSYLFCRWRLIFSWRIWNWLSPYWNKCFFTMIMVLIVLFLGEQSTEYEWQISDYTDWQLVVSICHVSAFSQTLYERCRSIQDPSPCRMPKWTQMCMTMSIWSCSEPRGISTYLVSLFSSGCSCHFHLFRMSQNRQCSCSFDISLTLFSSFPVI